MNTLSKDKLRETSTRLSGFVTDINFLQEKIKTQLR